MTAYICDPKHFAALAAFAVDAHNDSVIYEWQKDTRSETAAFVAEMLAKENIRSVRSKYPGDDENLPGPIMPIDKIINQAREYTKKFCNGYKPNLQAVDIISMCQSYDYQTCETDNWTETLAYRQIQRILSKAYRLLPGYDNAIRDYEGQKDNIWLEPRKLSNDELADLPESWENSNVDTNKYIQGAMQAWEVSPEKYKDHKRNGGLCQVFEGKCYIA